MEDINITLSEYDYELDAKYLSIKNIFRIKPIKNKEIISLSGKTILLKENIRIY